MPLPCGGLGCQESPAFPVPSFRYLLVSCDCRLVPRNLVVGRPVGLDARGSWCRRVPCQGSQPALCLPSWCEDRLVHLRASLGLLHGPSLAVRRLQPSPPLCLPPGRECVLVGLPRVWLCSCCKLGRDGGTSSISCTSLGGQSREFFAGLCL